MVVYSNFNNHVLFYNSYLKTYKLFVYGGRNGDKNVTVMSVFRIARYLLPKGNFSSETVFHKTIPIMTNSVIFQEKISFLPCVYFNL